MSPNPRPDQDTPRMTGSTVGIKEIAAAAGVSIATVSRHLSGKTIRPAYRARVEEALSRLDYRPNLAARRLRSGDAGLIGLVVPDIGNPFFVALIRAVETLAWHEGLRVILCNSDEDPSREGRLLSMLEDERVSGILIAPAIGSSALDTALPHVLVDRTFPGAAHDAVLLDNAGAVASLVDILQAEGRRQILGLFGQSRTTAEERRRGFTERIAYYGLPLSTLTVPHDPVARRLLVRTTIDATELDAVVCGDSLILLDAAIALGESPGRAVRLAGFDAADWQRLILLEPITIVQPVEEIAHAALALLIARMAGDKGDPTTVTFGGWIAPANASAPADQARKR